MLQTAFNGLITGVIMTLPALALTLLSRLPHERTH